MLVKHRDSNDSDISGVAVLLFGVGISHRAKGERGNTAGAVTEAGDSQFLSGTDHVAPLAVRARLAIHHIQAVDGEHEFELVRGQISATMV